MRKLSQVQSWIVWPTGDFWVVYTDGSLNSGEKQLRLVVLSHCLQGFIDSWWLAGFLPSTVVKFTDRNVVL